MFRPNSATRLFSSLNKVKFQSQSTWWELNLVTGSPQRSCVSYWNAHREVAKLSLVFVTIWNLRSGRHEADKKHRLLFRWNNFSRGVSWSWMATLSKLTFTFVSEMQERTEVLLWRDTYGARVHSKNETPVLGSSAPVKGVKLKLGWFVFWLFFKIGLCSAVSLKRSRREL